MQYNTKNTTVQYAYNTITIRLRLGNASGGGLGGWKRGGGRRPAASMTRRYAYLLIFTELERRLDRSDMSLSPFRSLDALIVLPLSMYAATCIPSIPELPNTGMIAGADISLYLWGCPTTCTQGGVYTREHSCIQDIGIVY